MEVKKYRERLAKMLEEAEVEAEELKRKEALKAKKLAEQREKDRILKEKINERALAELDRKAEESVREEKIAAITQKKVAEKEQIITKKPKEQREPREKIKSSSNLQRLIDESENLKDIAPETGNRPTKKINKRERDAGQDRVVEKEIKREKERVKTDYTTLDKKALAQAVKDKMIEFGARTQMIDKDVMIEEFGAVTLKKMIQTGLVISKNNKFTIGM